jgi:chemosensory pili system protein ChpA (sensor histidine kinase/response regulator)
MAERAARLADRLDGVAAGGEPQPLEQWMEELYRRVSDHQTMGSVVDELRATLAEAEKSMDQFFRNPEDVAALKPVPGCLQQMRGVLSVLGLDQASLAVVRMRDTVERLLINDIPAQERQVVFEKLGNSLGALGFLIDMLSYQRTMARKLFVYDEELGELRILMGRVRTRAADNPREAEAALESRGQEPEAELAFPDAPELTEPSPAQDTAPALLVDLDFSLPATQEAAVSSPVPLDVPAPDAAEPASVAPPVPQDDDGEDELLDIFLEEAREVVANGLAAVAALHNEPGDLSEQTTLRRAFHTLKGSSRMVGLNDFGEAAWSMEQTLNAWLAEQKPIKTPLLQLSSEALQAFGRWADDIATGSADHWNPQAFQATADAMRVEGTLVPLEVPGAAQPQAVPEPAALPQEPEAAEAAEVPLPEDESPADTMPGPAQAEAAPLEFDLLLPDIDLGQADDFADTSIHEAEEAPSPEDAPAELTAAELAEEIDFAVFEQAVEAAAQQEAPAAEAPAEPAVRRISHPKSSWKSPRAHRICTQPAPSPRFPRSPRCPRRKASMQPRLRRSMRPSRSSSTCASAYRCTTSTSTKRTNGRDGWSRRCRSGRWSCTDRCPIRRWRWPIPSQAAPPPWGSRRCRKWRACWSMRCSTCSCSRAACPSRRSASMRQPTTSAACCTSSPPVSSRSPTRSCWSSCKPSCRPR